LFVLFLSVGEHMSGTTNSIFRFFTKLLWILRMAAARSSC